MLAAADITVLLKGSKGLTRRAARQHDYDFCDADCTPEAAAFSTFVNASTIEMII
jgi:hypothetical protein